MSTDSTNSFLGGFDLEDEDELAVKSEPRINALDANLYSDSDYAEANNAATERAATAPQDNKTAFSEIDQLLEANHRALSKRYPEAGLRASRIITSTILLKAPHDYFDRFQQDVEIGTSFVQNSLTTRGGTEIVARSQANPTNEAMQEAAYNLVKSSILEFLGKRTWPPLERAIISQLITNEIIGFSTIDPLWRDKTINEIAVGGPFQVSVEIAGRWHYVRSCKFRTQGHLEQLLERLYQSVGKSLSRMTPQVKGRLHDNSRLYSSHKSIMPHGPSLNVRRHPERHWTPMDMVERGAASEELMADIGNLIYKGCSYLVVGGTSTGKTSMLNALTGFYRNDIRILTVEDSLELKPNPNKMLTPGMETLPARPETGDRGVSIRDLVRGTLQMAPAVIIVGESTGGEAFDLCQALNTGHAGASTVHANTVRDTIPRLMSMVGQGEIIQAEAALPLIGAAFDFIIFLEHSLIDGSRKILEVAEIPSYPEFDEGRTPHLIPRPIWRLDRETSSWKKVSEVSEELIERRGLNIERDLTWEELKELSKV